MNLFIMMDEYRKRKIESISFDERQFLQECLDEIFPKIDSGDPALIRLYNLNLDQVKDVIINHIIISNSF